MTDWKKEWKPLAIIIIVFLLFFYLPVDWLQSSQRLNNAFWESLHLLRWYAREHVILCLVPAFFIAGAIGVFVSSGAVMKYLGPNAKKSLAYGVAAVSGSVLAVCSCTILPLFAGIYRMGAGLGPAIAFLYSGPAINVLAIIMTARILGPELGAARAIGAVVFSVVIGLLMAFIFRHEKLPPPPVMRMESDTAGRSLFATILFFASMIGVLVFANFGSTQDSSGIWHNIYAAKWQLTSGFAIVFAIILIKVLKFNATKIISGAVAVAAAAFLVPGTPELAFGVGAIALSYAASTQEGEPADWFSSSFGFAKQIFPLLFAGVFIAGLLLGRPDTEGLIPAAWVNAAVGGNSIWANFFASFAGAFMYFATLTEVPILEGLIGNGMGQGPALALLLAGPALSLPNMLVIQSVIGTRKTVVFVSLVIIMATISGKIFGLIMGG
jgi:uncharacterized membrane protein YraQ (UPF0718 family)